MKRLLVLGFVVSLSMCSCLYLRQWEIRFDAEFQLGSWDTRTPKHSIPFRYSMWLKKHGSVAEKHDALVAVDKYWDLMCELYPWARTNFDPSLYPIYLHDKVGAFVAGDETSQVWASGWAHGNNMIIAWSWQLDDKMQPDGLASQDPFGSLCHEWFHAILSQRYGWGEPGHNFKFPALAPASIFKREIRKAAQDGRRPVIPQGEYQKVLAQIAMRAPIVLLSMETQRRALAFRYVPWCLPGRRR